MSPRELASPVNPKNVKRKRVITFLKLTSYVIKKLREITIIEDDNDSLPFKKRKISDYSIKESLEAEDVPLFVTNKVPNLTLNKREFNQKVLIIKRSPMTTSPEKKCVKQIKNIKKKSPNRLQIKLDALRNTIILMRNPIISDFLSSMSLTNLQNKFKNCVNFILPSKLQRITNIESIVQRFSIFGKVSSIQDHWIRPNGSWKQFPSVWRGATVMYRDEEGLNCAMKACFVEMAPVICVHLAEHLTRIGSVELEYLREFYNFKNTGTIILVENIHSRMPRDRFEAEFECYGTVLNVYWHKITGLKRSCEITYKSTTSAVAAALALDGKNVQRSILKTRIKMTSKEIFIHRKLCQII